MNSNKILRNLRETKMSEPAHKSLGPKKASKCWKKSKPRFFTIGSEEQIGHEGSSVQNGFRARKWIGKKNHKINFLIHDRDKKF